MNILLSILAVLAFIVGAVFVGWVFAQCLAEIENDGGVP